MNSNEENTNKKQTKPELKLSYTNHPLQTGIKVCRPEL